MPARFRWFGTLAGRRAHLSESDSANAEKNVHASMPLVIENVQGARHKLPGAIVLCGQMFGLGVVRHRLFEANFFMRPPEHPNCSGAVTRDLVSVTGHG